MSTSNSDEVMPGTPPEIIEAAQASINKLLPTKSLSVYEASYERFLKWCSKKKVTGYSENVLLAYFGELSQTLKSSSLWSHYSMIKLSLNIKKNVDISRYLKLRAFLKKQGENYKPKKSKVLSQEDFDTFIRDAPDEKYLGTKVVLIFGVSGGCRCHELIKMTIDDIEDCGSVILVKVPDTKTNKSRSFTILGNEYLTKYRQYASLRPGGFADRRFFLKYQNGKCYKMVVGIHKIGNAAKEVARYLKLPDYMEYTGHCLRRTSATFLVDGGADITTLKRHGGWRSSSVAEGYIEDSLRNKIDIARKILKKSEGEDDSESTNSTNHINLESVDVGIISGDVKGASVAGNSLKKSAKQYVCETSSSNYATVLKSKLVEAGPNGLLEGANISDCIFNITVNNNK